MKRLSIIFFLISINLFCQDYLNVQLTSGSKYGLLDDISKITFNAEGTVINFEMTNGSTDSENLDDILKITFDTENMGDVSLPVELQDFRAVQSGDNIRLYWETASEVDNYGFEIERRHDDISEWKKIGFREGNGSCTSPNSYSFIDEKVPKLQNLKYRLKQIDYDGTYAYSPEISVITEEVTLPSAFLMHNNYPNPFNPTTTIAYDIPTESFVTIKVYDVLGKEVESLVHENKKAGSYQVSFNGSRLSSGIYICRMSSAAHSSATKMIIMK